MASDNVNAALVQAYLQALSQNNTTQSNRDPVKNVIFDEPISIDHLGLFDFLDANGYASDTINTVNIQNAATLYAIMVIGDQMGVFQVADAVMKYATLGRIDIESTSTATRLYGFMKLRSQRTTAQERAMFYRQVFDLGDSEGVNEMATNTSFWPLMESLFHHVIEFIRKYEVADEPQNISQSPVRQIIRDLQHNLSRAASGMIKVYIPEMYAHLEDAIQIISAPEIRDQIGQGVARDVWNVVEQVSMEEFGHYPNTSALRTVAAAARSVLLDLARYSDASFDNSDFQQFIDNVEAFIVAQSQVDADGYKRPENGYMNYGGMYRRDNIPHNHYNNNRNGHQDHQLVEDDWDF